MIVKAKTAGTNGKKPSTRAKASGRSAEQADAKEDKRQTKVLEAVLNEVTAQPVIEHLEEDVAVACPYCGEEFEIHVTTEQDGQSMYEDCQVCCRPISLHVQFEDGELQVEAYRS